MKGLILLLNGIFASCLEKYFLLIHEKLFNQFVFSGWIPRSVVRSFALSSVYQKEPKAIKLIKIMFLITRGLLS
jgi:hypothetical protein